MGKRPWFQFHLSTAIIVTLTAGLLLGINMEIRQVANAERLMVDQRDMLVPQRHSRSIVCPFRSPGFDTYVPYLSVLMLAGVAATSEWWARRGEARAERE